MMPIGIESTPEFDTAQSILDELGKLPEFRRNIRDGFTFKGATKEALRTSIFGCYIDAKTPYKARFVCCHESTATTALAKLHELGFKDAAISSVKQDNVQMILFNPLALVDQPHA